MPTYVYSCNHPEHERWQISLGMTEIVTVICPKCHQPMYRVPQPFRFYQNPGNVLLEKLTERFVDLRKEQKYGIKRKYARGEPI